MFRLLIALVIMIPGLAYGYECNREIDKLSIDYGVPIHCKLESFTFSASSISGKQSNEVLMDGVVNGLNKFLYTYGRDFISRNIEEIILLDELKYNGQDVGGLSDGNKIYICLDYYTSVDNYRDKTYFINLNHEFSSNIYSKMKYTKKIAWRTFSSMFLDSVEYLRKCLADVNYSRYYNEALLASGHLANYALTNMENDFNVYAEKLFSGDLVLMKAKNQYKNVNKKLEILKEAYRELGFKGKFPDET